MMKDEERRPARLHLAIHSGKAGLVSLCVGLSVASCDVGPDRTARDSHAQLEPIFVRGVDLATLNPSDPMARAYRDSQRRFPDLQSCLVDERQNGRALAIDWQKIGSERDADVCIQRVVKTLPNDFEVKNWLLLSGFTLNLVRKANYDVDASAKEQSGTIFDVNWKPSHGSALRGPLITGQPWRRSMSKSIGSIIFISDSRKVVSVNTTINIL